MRFVAPHDLMAGPLEQQTPVPEESGAGSQPAETLLAEVPRDHAWDTWWWTLRCPGAGSLGEVRLGCGGLTSPICHGRD